MCWVELIILTGYWFGAYFTNNSWRLCFIQSMSICPSVQPKFENSSILSLSDLVTYYSSIYISGTDCK